MRLILLLLALSTAVAGQESPALPTASEVLTYKTVGEDSLQAHIFNPPNHEAGAMRPAIVFFFGGGWNSGTPSQFTRHSEYLAARGMVAIPVDYRVFSRHGVRANSCVEDAKSAIRWMRMNADSLGIDPDRIVAAGGSAGGHLAASTGTLPGHDHPEEDSTFSSIPNAMALFNPVTVTAAAEDAVGFVDSISPSLAERMGADPVSMSPYHNVKPGVGPAIVFHGTEDKTVAYETAQMFCGAMLNAGNRCELETYEGEGHGFFNYGRKNNGPFVSTVRKLDDFLVSLGYLEPVP